MKRVVGSERPCFAVFNVSSKVGKTSKDIRCVSAYFVSEFVAQQGHPKTKRRTRKILRPKTTSSSPSGSCSSTLIRGLCAAEQKRRLEEPDGDSVCQNETIAKEEGEGGDRLMFKYQHDDTQNQASTDGRSGVIS